MSWFHCTLHDVTFYDIGILLWHWLIYWGWVWGNHPWWACNTASQQFSVKNYLKLLMRRDNSVFPLNGKGKSAVVLPFSLKKLLDPLCYYCTIWNLSTDWLIKRWKWSLGRWTSHCVHADRASSCSKQLSTYSEPGLPGGCFLIRTVSFLVTEGQCISVFISALFWVAVQFSL